MKENEKLNKGDFLDIILHGDCLEKLKEIDDNSIDVIVTDPPYGIKFMGKDWDKAIPEIAIWKEVRRVLKPGSFAFIMSAPRQDVLSRMIVNLEEAGFITNFSPLYWTYASGFPKAHNIAKALNKKSNGKVKDFKGSYAGFQPKPAVEVIIVAMKPCKEKTYIDQALSNGKGVTWLGDCKIPYADNNDSVVVEAKQSKNPTGNKSMFGGGMATFNKQGRFPANLLISENVLNDSVKKTPINGNYSRYFSLDAWADENLKDLPGHMQRNFPFMYVPKASKKEKNLGCDELPDKNTNQPMSDAKWQKKRGRNPEKTGFMKNNHPTVKPIKLMAYLITMGSRENDVILDPFAGSGTTCIAAKLLNRRFIGIEINQEYCDIAAKRLEADTIERRLYLN